MNLQAGIFALQILLCYPTALQIRFLTAAFDRLSIPVVPHLPDDLKFSEVLPTLSLCVNLHLFPFQTVKIMQTSTF